MGLGERTAKGRDFSLLIYMTKEGRTYLNVVFKLLLLGRTRLLAVVSGKRRLSPWNCIVFARLHISSGMVAVLMICTHGLRTRWRPPISSYICSTAPFSVVSRNSLYMLWKPVRLWYRTQMP